MVLLDLSPLSLFPFVWPALKTPAYLLYTCSTSFFPCESKVLLPRGTKKKKEQRKKKRKREKRKQKEHTDQGDVRREEERRESFASTSCWCSLHSSSLGLLCLESKTRGLAIHSTGQTYKKSIHMQETGRSNTRKERKDRNHIQRSLRTV